MSCYRPNKGYRKPNGQFTFKRKGSTGVHTSVVCGKCIGCRLDNSRDWAVRSIHEAQTQEENGKESCFLTLTYDNDHLPKNGSLNFKHFQNFMKLLRKEPNVPKIKYFHCGEYGDKTHRPHYHALLFGYNFPDKEYHCTRDGNTAYISSQLKRLWKHGLHEIGNLTFASAAYTARYILKKQYGEEADVHYNQVTELEPDTGEILQMEHIQPEYTTMSNGIGSDWYDKYAHTDVWVDDSIIVDPQDGTKPFYARVPRYYREKLKESNPDKYNYFRAIRIAKALSNPQELLWERLETKEFCKTKQVERLIRQL